MCWVFDSREVGRGLDTIALRGALVSIDDEGGSDRKAAGMDRMVGQGVK